MLPIARVRLKRPAFTAELVRRPRLIAKLNQGLGVPVTLISAPAGSGKTTLLLDWLEQVSLPVAWLSLEASDDSTDAFTTYLVAAIRTVFPRSLASVLGLLRGSLSPEPTRLADALADALSELAEEMILVFDDYHLMKSPEIQGIMAALVRRIPPSVHLVISARYDVTLPLARLHAEGKTCELRSSDLRFTTEEMRELLTLTVKREIAPETQRILQESVEGWVMGIRFAALSLRAGTDAMDLFHLSRQGSNQHLMDYFLNEIFLGQTPAAQEFLLKTCMLERFTPGACKFLLEGASNENWREILNQLVRNELMITALDESGEWYRYHHLFRDFLRSKAAVTYPSGTIAELNRRAGQWNAAQGFITEAVQYAIAAGDYASAAQLVGTALRDELDRETARSALESWLTLFPAQEWDRHLELVMAQLWLAQLQFRLPVTAKLIPPAEKLLTEAHYLEPADRNHYRGEIAQAKIALAFFVSEPARVLDMSPEALDNLPLSSVYARGNVLGYHAISQQMMGHLNAGVKLLTDSYGQYAGDSPYFMLRMKLALAWVHLNHADYHTVAETAERMLELARDRSYITLSWAHYFLGVVHYEWNQLQAAAQHFALGAELRFSSNAKVSYESFARLALTQQAQGFSDKATGTLQQVLHFGDEMHSADLAFSGEAYRARLALAQGNTGAALRWAETVSLSLKPHMMWEMECQLTRIQILIAARKRERVQTALTEANTLLDYALTLHDTRRIIQLYALQALALDALGQTPRALDALEKSIELAEPGGFKRTFLDLGPRMARLLLQLLARNVSPAYIASILLEIPKTARRAPDDPGAGDGSGHLIEPLTMREMQVLEALANRMTNKEIALSLVISPLTVKTHIDHIFTKLNVNNRGDAVRVAAAYGLVQKSARTQFTADPDTVQS